MASNFSIKVSASGSSEGDAILADASGPLVEGIYNRFVINGGASDAITLDMSAPPLPMGTVITSVLLEVESGSVDVTFSSAATSDDTVSLNTTSGSAVFALSPVELSYLKVAPTAYTKAVLSVMSRE